MTSYQQPVIPRLNPSRPCTRALLPGVVEVDGLSGVVVSQPPVKAVCIEQKIRYTGHGNAHLAVGYLVAKRCDGVLL